MSRRVLLLCGLSLGVALAVSRVPSALSFSGATENVGLDRAVTTWALLNVVVGAVLIWQRPALRYPWLMFGTGLIMAILQLTARDPGGLYFEVSTFPALLAQLFPTGRPVRGRWGWLTYALPLGYLGLALAARDAATQTHKILSLTAACLWVAGLLATVPIVAVRFRRSVGVERAQLKWFLLTVAVAALCWIVGGSLPKAYGGEWAPSLTLSLPILGIVIALLRYHLYDIDRVISRAASYVVVTGLLVVTYLGVVFLATSVLGQKSSLAVAAATLAAAAIFRPVLRRVRSVVDHRFNRSRYDATETVTRFARTLDRQVELASIESSLMVALQRTVSPASLSLWLRSDS